MTAVDLVGELPVQAWLAGAAKVAICVVVSDRGLEGSGQHGTGTSGWEGKGAVEVEGSNGIVRPGRR